LRSDINRPKLVRLLGACGSAPAAPAGTDFAERLGRWLNAFDAVNLQAAHQSIRAIRAAAPRNLVSSRSSSPQALAEDLQRVRATLAQAIAQDPVPFAIPKLARRAPGDTTALPTVVDAGYAPYQQRHLKLQRQMEQLVAPLRDHVREVLSQSSPGLRQLAALDAALDPVLTRREQLHLPAVAPLLQRRFEALARDHEAFRREWTEVLLAELDLRLDPVAGLIAALANE